MPISINNKEIFYMKFYSVIYLLNTGMIKSTTECRAYDPNGKFITKTNIESKAKYLQEENFITVPEESFNEIKFEVKIDDKTYNTYCSSGFQKSMWVFRKEKDVIRAYLGLEKFVVMEVI